MEKNKRLSGFVAFVIILLLSALLLQIYLRFYKISPDERIFQSAVVKSLSGPAQSIWIRDTNHYDWDTVCFLPEYAVTSHTSDEKLRQLIAAQPSSIHVSDYPILAPNSAYAAALIFILQNHVSKILPLWANYVRIDNKDYFFKTEFQKNCGSRNAARIDIDKSRQVLNVKF